MLCVLILYISGGTYSLKSTPNDRVIEKLLMAILFTLKVFANISIKLLTQSCIGFANKIIPGVSEGILCAEHDSSKPD